MQTTPQNKKLFIHLLYLLVNAFSKIMIFYIKTLAGIDSETPQHAAQSNARIQMDFAIIGDVPAVLHRTIPRIEQNYVLARQIPHGRMPVQDTLFSPWQNIRFLEKTVVYKLFGTSIFRRQEQSVPKRQARMHADKFVCFYIKWKQIEPIHRFPIEKGSVRKISSQLLQNPIVIFRLLHQSTVKFQKIVFVIASDTINVRHRKQQLCQTNTVRSFVDDISQHIELISAAESDLIQQPAEQIVMTVNIGNAIIHISIIPFAAIKSNTF